MPPDVTIGSSVVNVPVSFISCAGPFEATRTIFMSWVWLTLRFRQSSPWLSASSSSPAIMGR
ncbi:hypothetical protein OEB94_23870 [Streptomyces sp. ICN988]|uniref:hypothetical protein n=1 Tax=unclassified Streptomyces TaxID=2593676 RepID=UPI0021E4BD0E|nr:hypothetical protein [Streptomyces sp. ICN988]MCV2462313.1 hypothetical protein [Streptomyces sp. ICN988]